MSARRLPSPPRPYLVALACAFLALALPHLRHPLVGWEEAIVPSAAIELLAGREISPHFVPFRIAGRAYPLLFNVRGTGAVESYAMLPVFKVFGVGVVVLRVAETILTLLAGLLFAQAASELFDEETADGAAPLILFNGVFLLYGTRDGFEGAILVQWLFLALALIGFARVAKGRGEYAPWTALALAGGVYAKLHFVGIALGMAAAWAGMVAAGVCPAPRRRSVAAAAACLAAGLLPFIGWNLHSGGESFKFAAELSASGPFSLVRRLGLRLLELRGYLCGTASPVQEAWPGPVGLAVRAVPIAAPLAFAARRFGGSSRAGTSLACLMTICAAYLVTISAMMNLPFREALKKFRFGLFWTSEPGLLLPGKNHVLTVLPLFLIAAAAAFRALIPGRAARAAAVALVLAPDLVNIRAFHESAAAAAVRPPAAVEQLARYLDENGIRDPLNVDDHDLGPELEVLTEGRVIPTQAVLFRESDVEERLTRETRRPHAVFLITHGRALSAPEKARQFEAVLAREGLRERLLRSFEDGRISLVAAEPLGADAAGPRRGTL